MTPWTPAEHAATEARLVTALRDANEECARLRRALLAMRDAATAVSEEATRRTWLRAVELSREAGVEVSE
jgi:hypothetical protein